MALGQIDRWRFDGYCAALQRSGYSRLRALLALCYPVDSQNVMSHATKARSGLERVPMCWSARPMKCA
jgi:hypothetical protein